MELKHTVGPWQFLFGQLPHLVTEYEVLPENDHNGKGWKFKEINVGTPDNNLIAKISAGTTSGHIQSYEEFEANAKLIAAAPILLDACMQVKDWLANDKDRQYESDVLLNAIRKATK